MKFANLQCAVSGCACQSLTPFSNVDVKPEGQSAQSFALTETCIYKLTILRYIITFQLNQVFARIFKNFHKAIMN